MAHLCIRLWQQQVKHRGDKGERTSVTLAHIEGGTPHTETNQGRHSAPVTAQRTKLPAVTCAPCTPPSSLKACYSERADNEHELEASPPQGTALLTCATALVPSKLARYTELGSCRPVFDKVIASATLRILSGSRAEG